MPIRKAKRVLKKSEEEKSNTETQNEDKQDDSFVDEEVERQLDAIIAIRDVEVDHTVTEVKLLRSYFTEEQLNVPAFDFFKENVPSLSIEKNEESEEIELKWKDKNGDLLMEDVDGVDMNYSIMKRLSMGLNGFCSRPSLLGGYDLPDNVKASLLGTENPQLENFVFEGTSGSQMFASHDGLQTPGATGQRLSYGMTPKTRRQPKPGELMLSVHGSPLEVYKEDQNMGAINEENS